MTPTKMQHPGMPLKERNQYSLTMHDRKAKYSPSSDCVFSHHKYASRVLGNLNALREDSRFCDVEIVADGLAMKVHRAVLCASSPYFHAMFTVGLSEEQKNRIELHSVSANSLKSLMEFIYTGWVITLRKMFFREF